MWGGLIHKWIVEQPVHQDLTACRLVRYKEDENGEMYGEQYLHGEWVRYEDFEVLEQSEYTFPGWMFNELVALIKDAG